MNWYDVICMQVKAQRGKPVSSVFDAMGPDANVAFFVDMKVAMKVAKAPS